ncbi:MAG: 1,4-alpha-glucan branching protein GlgB [Candidatus Caenarcaniphilales bacterium]|nr:1,4-alpha-glucan branching protein GlgB [Candidatus Caenarcaniphilales bacterium]
MSSNSLEKLKPLIEQYSKDPHAVLGMHKEAGNLIVRAYEPNAEEIFLMPFQGISQTETDSNKLKLDKISEQGFFEISLGDKDFFAYKLEIKNCDGIFQKYDTYSFLPSIDSKELYYFNEGTDIFLYEKLGAHFKEVNGVEGFSFTVWAPEAVTVFLIGEFNCWHNQSHPMRMLGSTGVWEIFIPGLDNAAQYKYRIKTKNNSFVDKADPMAFYSELRPGNSSRLWKRRQYEWNDANWLEKRQKTNWHKSPISIYEIHLGSWKRKASANEDLNAYLTYREYADQLIPYIKKMGFTHVEFMPLSEFPFDGSWGYQVSGYFAPTCRFGNPDELKYLIDQLHQNDIGVIFDWVPAHFPKDRHSLARFDGTALYEHEDPRQGEHAQWGTYIFNYGRTEVKSFLISNAYYWLKEFHIDGLRVDAVSSMIYLNYGKDGEGNWVPNKYGGIENLEAVEFLRELNRRIHSDIPGVITIAEESTAWPCVSKPIEFDEKALGFDFKWNMGWMHDTLKYMSLDPLYRKHHHNQITFSMAYFYNENFVLPLSHDEVVHLKGSILNKMSGNYFQQIAQVKLLYSYMYAHPGKKLLFMGAEIAQQSEWAYERSLDWERLHYNEPQFVQKTIEDLNQLYKNESSFYREDHEVNGFKWIECNDSNNSTLSFIRKSGDEHIICVFNFTPVVRYNYRLGCPNSGSYIEIFNSDSEFFGGSNEGNYGKIESKMISQHGFEHSLDLTIPSFGAIFLRPKS